MPTLYNPAHFRIDDREALTAFISAHPLATLVSHSANGLSVSHIPMILEATTETPSGLVLRGHVARANPHWKELGEGQEALAIFHGPQAYITPQWYPSKLKHAKVVPTWNYAVAHVRGTLRAIDNAPWLHRLVSALTTEHEKKFAHQWAVTDAPDDYIAKMVQAIVGLELTVTTIEGKWKLSQNRDDADRSGALNGLAARDDAGSAGVHDMMKGG